MQVNPIIYADPAAQVREQRFQALQFHWIAGIIFIVVSLTWLIIRTDVSREPELPNRPFTKADVPLLKKKVKFLKSDAADLATIFPHLKNQAEIKTASQTWEELYYTPEIFPAARDLHQVENGQLLQLFPDLADQIEAKQSYEEGRYDIANNSTITDKAAAIDTLKKRLGPALKQAEDIANAKEVVTVVSGLVGDPEYDNAKEAYEQACATAILKRHPELAGYYRDLETHDEAYHHLMSQANALSRQITALENGTDPAQAANGVPVPSTPVPDAARRYGVVVGDTVDVSAVTPPIALHRATLTAMNDDLLIVRDGKDNFSIHWPDVIHLTKTGGRK